MKIALVKPNYHAHLITPPLGIGYVSSFLKSKGYEVIIVDGLNRNLNDEQIIKEVETCELVGLSVLSAYYLRAKELSEKLKAAGKIVVWGGVHATVMPDHVLKETKADYVVCGEGEMTAWELIQALENNHDTEGIPGLYSRSTQRFIPREFIQDLDSLPFPDWAALDPRTYQKAPHGALIKNFPVAPITSTRGCPYECTFCVSPKMWRRSIRFRSPKNVVDEIEYLAKEFGIKEIHFEDDNFTLKREHAATVCEEIMRRHLKISFTTPNGIRADKVDEDLLLLMKKAGCYFVGFGIESGNQYIIDNIKKHEKLEIVEKAIRLAHKVGLMTQGFFIFGLPGETKDSIKQTIKFAKSVPLDRAQFLLLDLIPGSELWEQHKNEIVYDYTKKSFQDTTWVPPTISEQDLKAAQPTAFREFFFRPRQIWSIVKYFKPSQLKFVLRRLKDFRVIK